MLAGIGLIVFLIYASLIFFIKIYYLLGAILCINIILMIILKVSFIKTFKFLARLMPFIVFTSVLNIFLGDVELGALIGIRLILVCNITYVFSCKMTPKKIQSALENVLIPLKLFKVNTKDIAIMVSISIAFIPIMQKEIQNVKYSLRAKGFCINLKNMIRRPNIVLVPLITSIIKKTDDIEKSMISKGYLM